MKSRLMFVDPPEYELPPVMRLNDACPFCHAEPKEEKDGFLEYACGTKGSRLTGLYDACCTIRRK